MLGCGSDEDGSAVMGIMVFEDEFSPSPDPITSDIVSSSAYTVTLDCVMLIISRISAVLVCVMSNEEASIMLDTVVPNEKFLTVIYLLGYPSSYIITASLSLHSLNYM